MKKLILASILPLLLAAPMQSQAEAGKTIVCATEALGTRQSLRVELTSTGTVVRVLQNGAELLLSEITWTETHARILGVSFDPIGATQIDLQRKDLISPTASPVPAKIEFMGAPGTATEARDISCSAE
ncbi:MAG: hypothetical protein U1E10_08570 [Bdellovibrionales bacterium]|nr:hypothetical protein [Bdellovibrionales bacterium]